jgi:hypothetical protein
MPIGPRDRHLMLDRAARSARLFNSAGTVVFECEARNRTVNDHAPPDQRWAPCPAGEFLLGPPVKEGTMPFGPYFMELSDYGPYHAMRDHGRAGIGVHGGGSGLADPFAPRQGWVCTRGCWRIENDDLERLVEITGFVHQAGGQVSVTVVPWQPGAALPGAAPDDTIFPPEEQLAPDE